MFSHDDVSTDDVISPSSRAGITSVPGAISDDDDEMWDDDGSLPDSGFGLPAMEKPTKGWSF